MALKIIQTTEEKYEPLQDSQKWEPKTIYICEKEDGFSSLYIEGKNCGSYNDIEIQLKIKELNTDIESIKEVSNLELEAMFQSIGGL